MPRFQYAVEILTTQRVTYSGNQKGLRFGVARVQPQGRLDEWFDDRQAAEQFRAEFVDCHTADARVATFRVQGGCHPNVRTCEDIEELHNWALPFEADLTQFSANLKTVNTSAPAVLDARETAMILHALRTVQCEGRIAGCAAGMCDHFADVDEMTNAEIDELCERLNFSDMATSTPAATPIKVYALATDRDHIGTTCGIYTDETELYKTLAEELCADEEKESVLGMLERGELEQAKDFLSEVNGPPLFTWATDEIEIAAPAPHIVAIVEGSIEVDPAR